MVVEIKADLFFGEVFDVADRCKDRIAITKVFV